MTLNVEGFWALDCTAQLSHRVAETGPPTKEQCSEQQFCDTSLEPEVRVWSDCFEMIQMQQ